MAKNKAKKATKIKPQTFLYALAVLLAAYFVASVLIVYFLDVTNSPVRNAALLWPFPAAVVEKKFLSIKDLDKRTESVRRFYENQDFSELGLRVDFTTEDGQKRLLLKKKKILNRMIEDTIIMNEANSRGIKLTPEMVSQEVQRKMDEYGSENFAKENLAKLYGWTLDDFQEKVVKPELYKDKLFAELRKNDSSYKTAREKIVGAKEELANTRNFEEVAKKYSDGESAPSGGELGWFSYNEMLPEVAKAIIGMDAETTSDIIESRIGYHIIRIEEKKSENNVEKLRLSQIFVRTLDFSEWLSAKEKEMLVFIPMRNFYWDKEHGQVEFSDETMKVFEENLYKNSADDASVIF